MDPSLYTAAMNGDLTYLQNLGVTTSNNLFQSQLTPCQETVLHVATEFHQTEFAKDVVRVCPALLRLANSSGDTALHIAAREGHEEIVEFFISNDRSSDIETGEYKRLTRMENLKKDMALHCAARSGRKNCVKLLVHADPEVCSFVNNVDESPLYLSIASTYLTNLEIIINCCGSSRASHKGPNGLTALHAAVLHAKVLQKYHLFNLKLLLEWRREMIKEADNLGMTPLHYAAFYGKIRAIPVFLEFDSSAIYLLNNDGQSAVHVAAFKGKVKALEQLINCHPDCYNMVDNKGRTALHAAVLGNQQVVVKFILKTPRLRRLINKADKDGNTPLHLAAHLNSYKIIQIFSWDPDLDVSILNNELFTPFDVYDKLYNKQDIRQLEEETYTTIMGIRYNLQFAKSRMANHQSAIQELKMMTIEPKTSTKETSTNELNKADERRGDFGEETALEVNLLVAMLVATVTFAAGFTVPGGLVNNGEDEGLATLTNNSAFKVFVVFNTLAFCCSIFAVLVHFTTSLTYREARVYYKGIAASFTAIAILAMVLAFSSGTYVVLTKSTGLSLVPCIIPASFLLLYPASRKLNTWIKLRTFGRDLEVPLYLRTRLFMDRRRMQRNKRKMEAASRYV